MNEARPARFLDGAFRPFFLGAGVWAVLAMAAWLLALGDALGGLAGAITTDWHVHEMLFGYGAAAMAGFLLTAVPNWTGRPALTGLPLGALAALWLGGRLAMLFSAILPPLPVALIDAAFLWVLCLTVARDILGGGNWRNAPVVALIALLALANSLDQAARLGALEPDWGRRLGVAIFAVAISLIGGRVTPSFTRNWLVARGIEQLPAPFGRLDRLALVTTLVATAAWVLGGETPVAGVLLMAAGLLLAARLGRWRGQATLSEPLLWSLHLGYAWLALGLTLLGLACFDLLAPSAALHALTAGAVGAMTLAIMTRATLGHAGRALTADRTTTAIFLCVTLAAATRVGAPWAGPAAEAAWGAAAVLWIAAFALFLFRYAPILLARQRT